MIETLFYDNGGKYAKYSLECSVVLHAAIEKILLEQLFFKAKKACLSSLILSY